MNWSETREKLLPLVSRELPEAWEQGLNLSGANLSGADLYRAHLRGANLSGANGVARAEWRGFTIIAFGDYLSIGCQTRTVAEWRVLTEDEITQTGITPDDAVVYRRLAEALVSSL